MVLRTTGWIWAFGLCLLLAAPALRAVQQDAGTAALVRVADAIQAWDGQDPGALFKAVKAANPDTPAIVSLRELNKALADKAMPSAVAERGPALIQKQKAAQRTVRTRVLAARTTTYNAFRSSRSAAFRSVYGSGDIGSWPTSSDPDASMDIDWTVFGTDPDVTAELRDACKADLLRDLAGNDSGLTLADFDVVITAEGHEAAAGVFETEGGIDWAKRNMKRVTIVQPDGVSRTYDLGTGDPIAEMAQAEHMARFRDLASKNGDYPRLFDAKGFLRADIFDNELSAEAAALWQKYTTLLSEFGIDFYRSRSSTATGGCLDMSKHLQEEVITKKHAPPAKLKKTLKYVARADNISRGVPGLDRLIAADSLLSDPAYLDVVALARTIGSASPAQVDALIRQRFGEMPDAGLQELGDRARRAILRMSELAFQAEMDRIILEVADKGARDSALQKLHNDFQVVAEEGGEYGELAKSATDQIAKVRDANNAGTIEQMREHYQSLEKLRQADQGLVSHAIEFLKQTELGSKLLDKGGKLLELGRTPVTTPGEGRYRSSAANLAAELVESSRAKGLTAVQLLGSAAMWTEVINNVRTAKSDAELAIALGHTLVNNTFFGMVLNSAYAGIVLGDNDALGKAVMYMLVPETALPALVEALGTSAINLGAQLLFDAQMDGAYKASSIAGGQITDFAGLGMAGDTGARYFVDAMAEGRANEVAQDIIAKSTSTEAGKGANAIAIVAVGASIRGTVDNGSMLVFKEDGPLLKAAGTITRVTDDINACAKIWGVSVARSAASANDLPSGLDRGQTAALVKLMGQRELARTDARAALADAMVRTFLERSRADVSLDSGKAKGEYEALLKIFADLGIAKEGAASLDAEGAPYNLITNWLTSTRQKQVTAVKAVQKFKDAYTTVLQARTRAESSARVGTGSDALSPRPLTGSLPLTASPTIDLPLSASFLEEVGRIGASVTTDLERIKKAKLEGPFDTDTAHTLYDIRFHIAQVGATMRGASEAQHLHWAIEIFDKQALYAQHSAAAGEGSALRVKEAALLTAYRDHYTVTGAFVVTLDGPAEITAGQQATLVTTVKVAGTAGRSNDVGADIARQFSYAWSSGKAGLGKSSSASRAYRLDTPGTHEFTVVVSRQTREAGRLVETKIGERSWSVKVTKPTASPSTPTTGAKPPVSASTPKPSGTPPGVTTTGATPPGATSSTASTTAPSLPSATNIPLVAFDPTFTTGAWMLQSVTDDTTPTSTGATPCPATLLTERNYYDDAKTKLRTEYTYYVDYGRTVRCGSEKRYYDTGVLQYEATRLHDGFEGPLKRYWATGKPYDMTTFVDGAKNGPYISYWDNNQVRSKGLFKRNRKYGMWSYYDRSGAIEAEGPYYKKFSTISSTECTKTFPNDPHELDEGQYWQCGGNRFGTWTVVRDGKTVTETVEHRGDVDDEVERDYWDRMSKSAALKALDADLKRVNAQLGEAEERASKPGCKDCSATIFALKKQADGIGDRLADERKRLHDESRAKFIVSGIDNEAPEKPKSTGVTGAVTFAGNGATTTVPQGTPPPASRATWTEFPKTVAWGQPVTIRLTAEGAAPSLAVYTQIDVPGFSGHAAEAAVSQPATWNHLVNALFVHGVSTGATRTIQVKHRGPGGLATRSFVYAWSDVPVMATMTVAAAANGRVTLGQRSAVGANITTAQPTPGAQYTYRWQPNPEVTFTPVEGSVPQGAAVFTRLGPVKLWVDVLQAVGARLATVTQSDQIEITVVPPSIALASSAEPRPGREVRVTTTLQPNVSDQYVDFWWEIKGDALQAGATANARVYSFIPKNTMPVTVTVHGTARDGGDDLGSKDMVITPLPFDVSVSGPRQLGPTPQTWSPTGRGGLVDVERPIVVFQNVSMRAEIAPQPDHAPLHYAWTVSSDACSISNPISQEPTFTCSEAGSYSVAVVVRDDLGCVLGSGTGRLAVTAPPSEPRKAASPTPATPPVTPPVSPARPPMTPPSAPGTTPPAKPAPTSPAKPSTPPSVPTAPAATPASPSPATPKPATTKPAPPAPTPPAPAATVSSPARIAVLFASGQELYDAGKYVEAVKVFDEVIAADPASGAAYAARGLAKHDLNDDAGAMADLDRALQLAPRSAEGYSGRSMVKHAKGDVVGALADAQRAVDLAPGQYRSYVARGLARHTGNDNRGALWDFTKAIALKSDYVASYAYRGSVRLDLKDDQGALADYDAYLKIRSNDSAATNSRGVAKEHLGDRTGALADYEKALALNPSNEAAKRNVERLKRTAHPRPY